MLTLGRNTAAQYCVNTPVPLSCSLHAPVKQLAGGQCYDETTSMKKVKDPSCINAN